MQVSVHASPDILGGEVSVPGSKSSVRIGTLYFDGEKLRDWMVHSGKESLALYEKMWIEGVGTCVCVCVRVHVGVWVCMCVCVCVYVCMCVCVGGWVDVGWTHICIWVIIMCTDICMYVCRYVCVCEHVFESVHVKGPLHAHI